MKQTTITCGPTNDAHDAPAQPFRCGPWGDDVAFRILAHDDAHGEPCANSYRIV